MWESINTDNPRKGGIAIMVVNPKIKAHVVHSDCVNQTSNWTLNMSQAELNSIELDSVLGKWQIIKFEWLNRSIHPVSYTHLTLPTILRV